ncbi:MAG: response regulator [Bacilli bacterium]|nr:response regulator [Bacilli bacterium]
MKTIIVADDSSIILNVAKKAFDGEYNVVGAANGEEAIKYIETNNLSDVVGMLLDLNMPKVDGYQVLDYLKTRNLFKTVPVSIITGEDDMENISKAFEYPIIDVLKKPFTIDNVRKIIEKTISISEIN